MNWDAVSAIGELIGATAVVVSLIYLAVQIRQNTRQISSSIEAAQLSAFERNIESGNRIREFFLLNPELFELYRKGWKSYLGLSSEERANFGLMIRNIFSQIQGAFIRQLSIGNDPMGLLGIEKVVDEILLGAGVQEFLKVVEPDWRPEFRDFVLGRLELVRSRGH